MIIFLIIFAAIVLATNLKVADCRAIQNYAEGGKMGFYFVIILVNIVVLSIFIVSLVKAYSH